MSFLSAFFSLIIGLTWGSFANVLIVRLPRAQSILRFRKSMRSSCPRCKKKILWKDNIPIFSFLFLRGRCRACHKKISIRYPIVELTTALLFLATQLKFGWSPELFLRSWPLIVLLVCITFIDLEHRIIPDELSLGGLGWGLLTSYWAWDIGVGAAVMGALLGFGFFYSVAWLYLRWTGRSGLGGGDIKLLAMLGAFLGPLGVLNTILISSIFGSIIGLLCGALQGQKNIMKYSFPFGPFLVTGALYFYLFGDVLWFRFMTPM